MSEVVDDDDTIAEDDQHYIFEIHLRRSSDGHDADS